MELHVTMLVKIVQDGATRHDVGEDRTGWSYTSQCCCLAGGAMSG